MLLLVSGATRTVSRLVREGRAEHLGVLLRPGNGNGPTSLPWGVDNGAFTGFDAAAFRALLAGVRGCPGCLFVAAPDVVGEGRATLALFDEWHVELRASGLPVAIVAQDGMTVESVPWDRVDAIFVGGSTAWKLGADARAIALGARRRDRWVHFGRVNSLRRMRAVLSMGAQSIDGTKWSRWSDTFIPGGLADLANIDRQVRIFDDAS